jgi:hypothetical protein
MRKQGGVLGLAVHHGNSRARDARATLVLNHAAERAGCAALPESTKGGAAYRKALAAIRAALCVLARLH